MTKAYDTCSLLELQDKAFKSQEVFYISIITLQELENIKTSATKDMEIKYRARHLLHLLAEHQDCYKVAPYYITYDRAMQDFPQLMKDHNDSKIIYSLFSLDIDDLVFITSDVSCYMLAKEVFGEEMVELLQPQEQDYFGYRYISSENEEDMAMTYLAIYADDSKEREYILQGVLPNEYVLIEGEKGKIVDKYKKVGDTLQKIPYITFESKMFGKVKPKDAYQLCAMDSLKSNKITMLRGAAGTGKSYLALGYLFSILEREQITKIIIFCNTVATAGAAKLGFYPGSRTEKLIDAQIGNFLSSKLGDRTEVERLISDGKLELLPFSDIRGYDTTGLNAGVYITEAQNLDIELMRLALQRIGDDCICILDGDTAHQVDLPLYSGNNNGMMRVSEVFRGQDIYGEVTLKNIYRSKVAQIAELI